MIPKEDSNCCLVSTKYSKIHCKHISQRVCGMICSNISSKETVTFQHSLAATSVLPLEKLPNGSAALPKGANTSAAAGQACTAQGELLALLPMETFKPRQHWEAGERHHCALSQSISTGSESANTCTLGIRYMNNYTGVG